MTDSRTQPLLIGAENLTPKEVSELLRVPESTLSVWRSTNRVHLPFFKLGGHVRYRRSDIDGFIQANTRGVRA
ncbi:DNA-binding protein, excisionase family [Burkholderiales bacterium JOSHI_001]|nr:DNA-binding protein, excisionase family [Burkholderiales bacterium JOSHI_001]